MKALLVRLWAIALFFGGSPLFAIDSHYQTIEAVIFDCDGVLVDTEYLKFQAWQEALSVYGVDFSIEEYNPLIGHSSKNILKMIGAAKKLELSAAIIELKNDKYKALQGKGVTPIQPMVDFARQLAQKKGNLKLGLASSAPKREILTNLQQIGLAEAFDLVISGSDDLGDYVDAEGKNKPKPYIYLESAKRLNIAPHHCLVFEDTKAGVDAAADAGMIAIAIPNRFTKDQDFSKASRVIASHQELPPAEIFQR